ncbi:MAG: GNAT family N-acetyltransferase [Gammaproteobacteria bacterium]|nr:GNAT family N-acetyltransferase [Gammaproteobacteria bacterium]
MKIIRSTNEHLVELVSWLSADNDLFIKQQDKYEYPVTAETFLSDVNFSELISYSLLDDQDNFIGFGQVYLRMGRCQLGRMVVKPELREKGYGKFLLNAMAQKGCEDLGVDTFSVLVYAKNMHAVKTYKEMDFVLTEYPGGMPFENGLYMVKARPRS